MTPPVGWYEVDPPPAPGSTLSTHPAAATICVCDHGRHLHDRGLDCDGLVSIEDETVCPCERFLSVDDVCEACKGAGVLGNVRNSNYDGATCKACGGAGFLESGRDIAAQQEVLAELAAEADGDVNR
jgi:hypothetical protein